MKTQHLATLGLLAALGFVAASCAQESMMPEEDPDLDAAEELAAIDASDAMDGSRCAGGDDADCLLEEDLEFDSAPTVKTLACGLAGAACVAGADCCGGGCFGGLCSGFIGTGYPYGAGYGPGWGAGLGYGAYGAGYGLGWGAGYGLGYGAYGAGLGPWGAGYGLGYGAYGVGLGAACGAVGTACAASTQCCGGGGCVDGLCI